MGFIEILRDHAARERQKEALRIQREALELQREAIQYQRESLKVQRTLAQSNQRDTSEAALVKRLHAKSANAQLETKLSSQQPTNGIQSGTAESRLQSLNDYANCVKRRIEGIASDEEMKEAYEALVAACSGRQELAAARSRKIWNRLLESSEDSDTNVH